MGKHQNKYKHLAEKQPLVYDHKNKQFRQIIVKGKPSEFFPKGTKFRYRGRTYKTIKDITLSKSGDGVLPGELFLEKRE